MNVEHDQGIKDEIVLGELPGEGRTGNPNRFSEHTDRKMIRPRFTSVPNDFLILSESAGISFDATLRLSLFELPVYLTQINVVPLLWLPFVLESRFFISRVYETSNQWYCVWWRLSLHVGTCIILWKLLLRVVCFI